MPQGTYEYEWYYFFKHLNKKLKIKTTVSGDILPHHANDISKNTKYLESEAARDIWRDLKNPNIPQKLCYFFAPTA